MIEKEWVTKHYVAEYARLENAILDFLQGSPGVLIGYLPMQEPNCQVVLVRWAAKGFSNALGDSIDIWVNWLQEPGTFAIVTSVYGRTLSKASTQTNNLSDLQLDSTLLQRNGQTYVASVNSATAKNPSRVVENHIVRL